MTDIDAAFHELREKRARAVDAAWLESLRKRHEALSTEEFTLVVANAAYALSFASSDSESDDDDDEEEESDEEEDSEESS